MALYFLDTSALVKLYVQEPGSARLLSLLGDQDGDRYAVLSLARVEARSAIRRRERAGDIDRDAAGAVLEALDAHMETLFLIQNANDAVIDAGLSLVDRHGLRAYDAMQLAGCLVAGAREPHYPIFVCADHELLKAAQAERCIALDPTAP